MMGQAMQFYLLSLHSFSTMILQMRLSPLHNGLLIPTTSPLLWLQVPLAQSPNLFKQCQETLYQRESHPKQKRTWILLQRELLTRAWYNLIILLLLLSLLILLTMVSLPLVGHDAILVITSKDLQRFDVYQLTVNNMTSLFQSSVSGTDPYQWSPIAPMFKPSTIRNNVSISLFLQNVTCSKTVGSMILNAFIKFIPTLSLIAGNQMIFTSQTF
jgi:hypothetical protein